MDISKIVPPHVLAFTAGATLMLYAAGAVAFITHTFGTLPRCEEDEVYTWVGDFPDHVQYQCIALDNISDARALHGR